MRLKQILMRANYLSVYVLIIPVGIVLQDNFPGSPLLKGQAPAIVASWGIASLAGIIWVRQRPSKPRITLGSYSLVALVIAWVITTILEAMDGGAFNYNTYLLPILLVMVLIKPLDFDQVRVSAAVLAVSTLLFVAINEIFAIAVDRRDLGSPIWLRAFGLPGLMDGEVRWEGPFGNPNYLGPVAVFLIIFGLSIASKSKWWIIVPAIISLLASGSRSAFLGLIVGLSCYFVFSQNIRIAHIKIWARLLVVGIGFVGLAALAFYFDPTLNARTPVWPLYLDFWWSSPVTGIGTENILRAIEAGEIGPVSVHAHNLMLDLMGRYGTFATVSVIAVLAIGIIIGIRAARLGNSVGLALTMAFVSIGITEVHGGWAYLNEPVAWLIIGILLSDSYVSSREAGISRPSGASQVRL